MTDLKIGFTGTRHGMTHAQQEALLTLLSNSPCTEFHHGDCIGADEQAHEIVWNLDGIYIVVHPPIVNKWRANNGKGCKADWILPAKEYLKRNQDIVDETDMLIAAPESDEEQPRSGTWQTIRYARKKLGKPVFIIYPNGFVGGPRSHSVRVK